MSLADALVALAVGVIAGAYAGLLGVGGGVVMVPAMVLLLHQPQRVAEGTSLLAIVGTALAATRAHSRRRLVISKWARLLAIGGAAGAIVGSILATVVIHQEKVLRRALAVFLLLVAVQVVLRLRGERG
jgi:uncharacterized membrane protein YfcA